MEFNGRQFQVTKRETTKLTDIAYELKGPRGGHYGLIRNQVNPHRLFAINMVRVTSSTPFEGQWFSDENGTLKLLG